jgi:hypothetical protein
MKFKIGESVKIQKNVKVENFKDVDFTDWQGRVVEYTDASNALAILVEWDSITLADMPEAFIKQCNSSETDLIGEMIFKEADLEKAEKRDDLNDRTIVLFDIEEEYNPFTEYDEYKEEDEEDEEDFDLCNISFVSSLKSDDYYVNVLGAEDISVSYKNLVAYLAFLKKELKPPFIVTGIESMGTFKWEERYSFGYGSKIEYNELRKKNPSMKDEYEILEFNEDEIEDCNQIFVKVRRLSDKKKFEIGLDELQFIDEKSENHVLLDDFVTWFVNY